MAAANNHTHKPSTEEEFLARCEEELKDRFTEKDELFMKVFNAEKETPPIVESWWSGGGGRRHDRRYDRRGPREPRGRPDRRRDADYERRGYSDYNHRDDHGQGYSKRPRY